MIDYVFLEQIKVVVEIINKLNQNFETLDADITFAAREWPLIAHLQRELFPVRWQERQVLPVRHLIPHELLLLRQRALIVLRQGLVLLRWLLGPVVDGAAADTVRPTQQERCGEGQESREGPGRHYLDERKHIKTTVANLICYSV